MASKKFSLQNKTLLVDGYNVIHLIPEFEKNLKISLESARKSLIDYCALLKKKQGSIRKIIIFFDGKSLPGDWNRFFPVASEIEVRFTASGEDADDEIIQFMEDSQQPELLALVSQDNVIINNAKAMRVTLLSAWDFYQAAQTIFTKTESPSPRSKDDERQITEEYKQYLGIKDS